MSLWTENHENIYTLNLRSHIKKKKKVNMEICTCIICSKKIVDVLLEIVYRYDKVYVRYLKKNVHVIWCRVCTKPSRVKSNQFVANVFVIKMVLHKLSTVLIFLFLAITIYIYTIIQ